MREDVVLPSGQRWRDLARDLAANDEIFAISIRKNFDADVCDDILGSDLSAEGIKRRWQKLRAQLEREPRLIAALAAVCVLVLLVVAYASLSTSRTPKVLTRNYWFYDMNSGELFTEKTTELPPIAAPSGSTPDGGLAGARAYLFSCGDCDHDDERFLAFIGITRPAEPKPFVRRPEDEEWVSMSSREGFKLFGRARERCNGSGKLAECFP